MQAHRSCSVDDAVAFLFPEDPALAAAQKNTFAAFNEDVDSYLAVLPSCFSDPVSTSCDSGVFNDVWDFADTLNTEPIRAHRGCLDTESTNTSEVDSDTASDECSTLPAQKEKKRLIAWTPEEHKCFVLALERLRNEDTESYNRHGKKTKGLGAGIADMIALALRTRTAAQVRSHAQKYFTRQRKEMGVPL